MMNYTQFDIETGRITSFGLMQDEVFQSFNNVIEGSFNDSKYYIQDYEAIERPSLLFDKTEIIANGVDEALASDLPNPFIFDLDGVEFEIIDGSLEFSTDIPGIYRVTPLTFPYKQEPIEIVAL